MATTFNEKRYLELNPDVAEAVAAGTMASGERHWEMYGRKEGRKGGYSVEAPTAFDAAGYLAANPDLMAAVNDGKLTAEEHYVRWGKDEGRKGAFAGTDVKTPTGPARSAQLSDFISRYADMEDPSGLRAGGLADQLSQQVVNPWRDSLRRVRDGGMTEAEYNTLFDQIVKKRDGILASANPDEFSEAIRYAGTTTPGFLEAVAQAGVSAVQRKTTAGAAAASSLSASDKATTDLQASIDAAAERDRVRNRRGRGATLLTGLAGLDDGGTSVARRLLAGA